MMVLQTGFKLFCGVLMPPKSSGGGFSCLLHLQAFPLDMRLAWLQPRLTPSWLLAAQVWDWSENLITEL